MVGSSHGNSNSPWYCISMTNKNALVDASNTNALYAPGKVRPDHPRPLLNAAFALKQRARIISLVCAPPLSSSGVYSCSSRRTVEREAAGFKAPLPPLALAAPHSAIGCLALKQSSRNSAVPRHRGTWLPSWSAKPLLGEIPSCDGSAQV